MHALFGQLMKCLDKITKILYIYIMTYICDRWIKKWADTFLQSTTPAERYSFFRTADFEAPISQFRNIVLCSF
jgi:hypothetical protein